MLPVWVPIAFFIIALFYAMVGFGGGSSYLAILVLAGLAYQEIPSVALLCNIIVAAGGCWHFYRAGHFRWRIILPFVVLSIPMAYLGGQLLIEEKLFCLLLGFSLLCVVIRMLLPDKMFEEVKPIRTAHAWLVGIPLGAGLGFLSGLVGIGGGIFLSPLLLFLRWVRVKQAAAAASFFILVNSLSGLAGQLHKGFFNLDILLPLALAVFVGGQIGSRLGATHVPAIVLRKALAMLILCASGRLLWGAL